jgi:hypothetical protein
MKELPRKPQGVALVYDESLSPVRIPLDSRKKVKETFESQAPDYRRHCKPGRPYLVDEKETVIPLILIERH